MTEEQIEAIRDREYKATSAPWVWEFNEEHRSEMPVLKSEGRNIMDFGDCEQFYPTEGTPPRKEDAEFIAHAREDIPLLLAEIERLKAKDSANANR